MSTAIEYEPLMHKRATLAQNICAPFWFSAAGHWCAAFWHHVTDDRRTLRTCAVLCPSLTLEQLCGSRHQRVLGRMLADAGIPTLRVSFPGTDNSSGHVELDDERSLIDAWSATVLRAIELTRARTGSTRVIVVGRRAGALIALNALRKAQPSLLVGVELIMWDPSVSGASYLRQARIRSRLRLASGFQGMETLQEPESPIVCVEQSFQFNKATIDDLRGLHLSGEMPVARASIVAASIDRHLAGAIASWPAERYRVSTASDAAFNFDEWAGPQLPIETIRALIELAIDRSAVGVGAVDPPIQSRAVVRCAAPATDESDCAGILVLPSLNMYEQWVTLDHASSLTGLLSTPTRDKARTGPPAVDESVTQALLLLGTGVDATAGEGDANVRFARSLASAGTPVLRLDFRGIGESPTRTPESENLSYDIDRIDDVRHAVHLMRERFPNAAIVAMGICSGAYWAIHSAATLVPIDEVIAINPRLYFSPDAPHDAEAFSKVEALHRALASASAATSWRRLFAGQYSVRVFRKAIVGLARTARERLTPARVGRPFANGFPRLDLDALFPSRTRINLIFSRTDVGYSHVLQHGASRLRKLGRTRGLTLQVVEDADHTFSSPVMRKGLERLVGEILRRQ